MTDTLKLGALTSVSYFVLVCFGLGSADSRALGEDAPPDTICQQLFESYIARQGMINASTVEAATHIVAERGRQNGFWTTVLKELQKGEDKSERTCILVLGKMLSIDASARDAIKREKETGEQGQWMASICLGPEVVQELITRGKAADRFRVDYYALALMRARVPEATEFFRSIVLDSTGKRYMWDAQFHAAVGLASLGEADGFVWLIKNCDDRSGSVQAGLPRWVTNNHLSTCSVAALRDLSGEKTLQDKKEWDSWWEKVDKKTLPKRQVKMNED